MRIEPDLQGVAIVLLGNFNPKIFQPFWFAANGLISSDAAETAEVTIIHPEISSFKIESQFSLQVERERLSIDRTVAPYIVISDLVGRIFGDLLPHTPIGRMGINRMVHFRVREEAERERIGNLLAPKEPWGEWGRSVSSGTGDKHGGMVSLTMVERNVDDRPRGWTQTKIEPSTKVGVGSRTGIYMEVTDHYEVAKFTEVADPHEIITLLHDRFDASVRKAETIIDQIMGLAQ